VTRGEILAHLEQRGLAWREDTTNRDGSNVRSRVRRELLPLIADIFGPGATLAPARLADLCEADAAHLEALGDAAWADLGCADATRSPDPLATSLPVDRLLALPAASRRRVLRRWLQPSLPQDLELAHIEAIERWLREGQSGTGLDLPGPLRLVRDFDRVRIDRAPPLRTDAAAWRVRVEPLAERPDPVPPPGRHGRGWRLVCAADRLAGNLQVRHPRPGDRLQPFGLAGHKKLSDLVQEKRIPRESRAGLLVVVDGAGPLWVVGVAQAERTRVLPATRQAVTIILEPRHEDLDS
jgi:tRNA(Ile)-lysidine synthase